MTGDTNVYPLNDLQEHRTDGAEGVLCPCHPHVDVEGEHLVIIHNAFDHREIVEQAIEIINGDDEDDTPVPGSLDDAP